MAVNYTNSPLAQSYLVNEVCYRNRTGNSLPTKITIHHTGGAKPSLSGLQSWFNNTCAQAKVEQDTNGSSDKWASSNYSIDNDGNIGLHVEEKYRALTSANTENDNIAVTIEVANSAEGPEWPVSDKAFNSLILLCVDICRRNNIEKLNYTGDTTGNLTRHDMFLDRTCPGPYLGAKFPEIVSKVNNILEAPKSIFEPRLTNPLSGNDLGELYYKTGGGNPYANGPSTLGDGYYGMPNCTCYAWGRFWEIIEKYGNGGKPNLTTGNAKDFYPTNKSSGAYEYGSEPKLGAIICWDRPGINPETNRPYGGHVAIVESITREGDQVIDILTSESGYKSYEFKTIPRQNDGNWGQSSAYTFQGFIYPPVSFQQQLGDQPPEDIDEYIWNFLFAYLRNPIVVAAIMGNMKAESNLVAYNLQQTGNSLYNLSDEEYTARLDRGQYSKETFSNDGFGYGLCQWTWHTYKKDLYEFKLHPRSFYMDYNANTGKKRNSQTGLEDVLNGKTLSYGSLELQLNFLLYWLWQQDSNVISNGKVQMNSQPQDDSWWKTLMEDKKTITDATTYFCETIERPKNPNTSTRINFANQIYSKFIGLTASTKYVNSYEVYDWMCGMSDDEYTIPTSYTEPKCKKCGFPISQCNCYFLKYDNIIVEEYIQPYNSTQSLYNPKGILLYHTTKNIMDCLYNTNATLPFGISEARLTSPLETPFHYMIGVIENSENKTTLYKTIKTYPTNLVIDKTGEGEWGNISKSYIQVLICSDNSDLNNSTISSTSSPKSDYMNLLRQCVKIKLEKEAEIPTTPTVIPSNSPILAGDEGYYKGDSLLNEITEAISYIYKKDFYSGSNKNTEISISKIEDFNDIIEDLPSLLSINEAYYYRLSGTNLNEYFLPIELGMDAYKDFATKDYTLYFGFNYNQWYTRPEQYLPPITHGTLESFNSENNSNYAIYNIYGEKVKYNGDQTVSNTITITNPNGVKWADGENFSLEDKDSRKFNKINSVTPSNTDYYFIVKEIDLPNDIKVNKSFIKGNI